ncbi:hypothetical protein A3762_06330 [Oleiphilus sp. HI0125]|uniref:hypothetical protein n=1 Tax=Oleiphilus sp. HI0125 TaxID=1822266 RepID=UPI0007C3D6D4|nr:hypothetical protein [Oleiphilus sp. HI0125]KZZ59025.1 hypothetical protein A3762_06330 [Oleiphilus sp. HI0125]
MDIVNKTTQKHFTIALALSAIASAAAYQWLVILMATWFLLLMGGVSLFRSANQKFYSVMWGIFIGLTLTLALLVFGPWELYT